MVIAIDENLFRIVEYSRTDNTPPGAPLTVPRRVIGGDDTHTEMMCGAYIDPKTFDVYVTNNDTQDWLPMFSREARGNVHLVQRYYLIFRFGESPSKKI